MFVLEYSACLCCALWLCSALTVLPHRSGCALPSRCSLTGLCGCALPSRCSFTGVGYALPSQCSLTGLGYALPSRCSPKSLGIHFRSHMRSVGARHRVCYGREGATCTKFGTSKFTFFILSLRFIVVCCLRQCLVMLPN